MPRPGADERLSLILNADVAGFEQGLKKASEALGSLASVAQRQGDRLNSNLARTVREASGIIGSLGKGATTTALNKTLKDVERLGGRVSKAYQSAFTEVQKAQNNILKTTEQFAQGQAVRERELQTTITNIREKGLNARLKKQEEFNRKTETAQRKVSKGQFALGELDTAVASLTAQQNKLKALLASDKSLRAALIQNLSGAGKGPEEIARRLGIAAQDVERELTRIRENLKKGLPAIPDPTVQKALRPGSSGVLGLNIHNIARRLETNAALSEQQRADNKRKNAETLVKIEESLRQRLTKLRLSDSNEAIRQQAVTSDRIKQILQKQIAGVAEAQRQLSSERSTGDTVTVAAALKRRNDLQKTLNDSLEKEFRSFHDRQLRSTIASEERITSALAAAADRRLSITRSVEAARVAVAELATQKTAALVGLRAQQEAAVENATAEAHAKDTAAIKAKAEALAAADSAHKKSIATLKALEDEERKAANSVRELTEASKKQAIDSAAAVAQYSASLQRANEELTHLSANAKTQGSALSTALRTSFGQAETALRQLGTAPAGVALRATFTEIGKLGDQIGLAYQAAVQKVEDAKNKIVTAQATLRAEEKNGAAAVKANAAAVTGARDAYEAARADLTRLAGAYTSVTEAARLLALGQREAAEKVAQSARAGLTAKPSLGLGAGAAKANRDLREADAAAKAFAASQAKAAKEAKALENAAARSARGVQGFSNALSKATASVTRLRTAIYSIRSALALLGTGVGVKESLGLATQFERELASVNTLLVSAQTPIESYREQILKLSRESSKDIIDLTKGLYTTISAGIPAIEGAAGAFELLTQAQKAAVAGDATTRQSVNALLTTVKAYSQTGITAAEASDKLFTTVRLGRTTFEDLSTSIGRILGITGAFNLSLDETLASVATITRVIPSTAESITQIRALIRDIVKPAKQVSNIIKQINEQTGAPLEFSAAALKDQGLSGIIQQILDVTGGDPDILARLFPNVRALGGAAILTAGTFKDFVSALDDLKNSAGATDLALSKVEGTIVEQSKVIKNRFQKVLIEIGERSFPLIRDVLEEIGDFVENNAGKFASFFGNLVQTLAKVFRFIKENFDTIVKTIEVFLIIRFPLAFAAMQGVVADKGEAFGSILPTLIFGGLGLAALNAGKIMAASLIGGFTTGLAGKTGLKLALASLFAGLKTFFVTAILAVVIAGVVAAGAYVNNRIDEQIKEFENGARDSLGFFGSLASNKTKKQAVARREEKRQIEALGESYTLLGESVRAAGIQFSDFHDLLAKNDGDIKKTTDEISEEVRSLQDAIRGGTVLALDPSALSAPFEQMSDTVVGLRSEVDTLNKALSELGVGLPFDQLSGSTQRLVKDLGKASEFTPRSGGFGAPTESASDAGARVGRTLLPDLKKQLAQVQGELDKALNVDAKKALEQAKDEEKIALARLFAIDGLIAAERDQSILESLKGKRAALEEEKALAEQHLSEVRRQTEELRGTFAFLGQGQLIEFQGVEQQFLAVVDDMIRGGGLRAQQVAKDLPKLTLETTFEDILEQSRKGLQEAVDRNSGDLKKFEETVAATQLQLSETTNDRLKKTLEFQLKGAEKNLEAARASASKALLTSQSSADGLTSQSAITLPAFDLGNIEDADQAFAALLKDGRFRELLETLTAADGKVKDFASSLKLLALQQAKAFEASDIYKKSEERLAEGQQKLRDITAARLGLVSKLTEMQAKGSNASFSAVEVQKVQVALATEQAKQQADINKKLFEETQFRANLFRLVENLISEINIRLGKANALTLADLDKLEDKSKKIERGIAEFDRKQEILRRKREIEDVKRETARLNIANAIAEVELNIASIRQGLEIGELFATPDAQIAAYKKLGEQIKEATRDLDALSHRSFLLDRDDINIDTFRQAQDTANAIKAIRKDQGRRLAAAQLDEAKKALAANEDLTTAQARAIGVQKASGRADLIPKSFLDELEALRTELLAAVALKDESKVKELGLQIRTQVLKSKATLDKADREVAGKINEIGDRAEDTGIKVGQSLRGIFETLATNVKQQADEALRAIQEVNQLVEDTDPRVRAIPQQSEAGRLLAEREAGVRALAAASAQFGAQQVTQDEAARDRLVKFAQERADLARDLANKPNITESERQELFEDIDNRQQQAELEFQAQQRQTAAARADIERKLRELQLRTSVLPVALLSIAGQDMAAAFLDTLGVGFPPIINNLFSALGEQIDKLLVGAENLIGTQLSAPIKAVLDEFNGAISLFTSTLLTAVEKFSSSVIQPLTDVTFQPFDRLLSGLTDAIGVLTDLTAQQSGFIRRGVRGSNDPSFRRQAAQEIDQERIAQEQGRIPRTPGTRGAGGRAVKALETAAKDAERLFNQIAQNLPAVVDRFFEILFDRGPELLKRTGDLLVVLLRKVLNNLPQLVKTFVPVLLDIVIQLVEELINQLPNIIDAFVELLNQLAPKLGRLFGQVFESILQNSDKIVESLLRAVPVLISAFTEGIVKAAVAFGKALFDVLTGQSSDSFFGGAIKGAVGFGLAGAGIGALVGGIALGPAGAALGAAFGAKAGAITGAIVGGIASFFHDGGAVTAKGRNPGLAAQFKAAGARGYRTGGVVLPDIGSRLRASLKGDEVPSVLQVGERVLSRRQVGLLGGQTGIDQLLQGGQQQAQTFETQVAVQLVPSGNDVMDMLVQALLPMMRVRGNTNAVPTQGVAGLRPARGR